MLHLFEEFSTQIPMCQRVLDKTSLISAQFKNFNRLTELLKADKPYFTLRLVPEKGHTSFGLFSFCFGPFLAVFIVISAL